jgi:TatA/E family protein of Tat protein translocase
MGSIGVPELIIIFVVALIVFGPKKLPELGKSLGKGLAEFRRASNELKNTIEEEVKAIEQETSTVTSTPSYPYPESPAASGTPPVDPSVPEAKTESTAPEAHSTTEEKTELKADVH